MRTIKVPIPLNGLTTEKLERMNSGFASVCTHLSPEYDGLIVKAIGDRIPELSTLSCSFPYPQLFILSDVTLICLEGAIYEYDNPNRAEKLYLAYTTTLTGKTWSVADFGIYLILTNGVDVVIKDPSTKTYYSNIISEQDHNIIPLADCFTNFNGQVIAGGVSDTWHSEFIESVYVPNPALNIVNSLVIEIQNDIANISTPVLSLEETVEETSELPLIVPQGYNAPVELPTSYFTFSATGVPADVPTGYTVVAVGNSLRYTTAIYTPILLNKTATSVSAWAFLEYVIASNTYQFSSIFDLDENFANLFIPYATLDNPIGGINIYSTNFWRGANYDKQVAYTSTTDVLSTTGLSVFDSLVRNQVPTVELITGILDSGITASSNNIRCLFTPPMTYDHTLTWAHNTWLTIPLAYAGRYSGMSFHTHSGGIVGDYFKIEAEYIDGGTVVYWYRCYYIAPEGGPTAYLFGGDGTLQELSLCYRVRNLGIYASNKTTFKAQATIVTANFSSPYRKFLVSVFDCVDTYNIDVNIDIVDGIYFPAPGTIGPARLATDTVTNVRSMYGKDTEGAAWNLISSSFESAVVSTSYRYYMYVRYIVTVPSLDGNYWFPELTRITIRAQEVKSPNITYTPAESTLLANTMPELTYDTALQLGSVFYSIQFNVNQKIKISAIDSPSTPTPYTIAEFNLTQDTDYVTSGSGYCLNTAQSYMYFLGGILNTGGYTNKFGYVDLQNGDFVSLTPLTNYLANPALVIADGVIYCFGGTKVGNITNSEVYKYDSNSGLWLFCSNIGLSLAGSITQKNITYHSGNFVVNASTTAANTILTIT